MMRGHLQCDRRLGMAAACILVMFTPAFAQKRGKIEGKITPASPDLTVVVINQVTSRVTRVRANADGSYSMSVRPGAYRVSVARPYVGRFDQAKSYGEHALIRDDSLENVIVSESKTATIDFAVEKIKEEPL